MRKKHWVAALMLVLMLTGCGGTAAKTDLMKDVTAREIPTQSSSEPLAELGGAVTGLGLELLKGNTGTESVLVSPVSVACALAMTANGAGGDTRTQMEEGVFFLVAYIIQEKSANHTFAGFPDFLSWL